MKGKRPEIGDGKPANTAFCRGQNGEMKRQDSASPRGRQRSRFSMLSFCRLISKGKMKGQAAECSIEAASRRGLSFRRFSPRVRVMRARVCAYIRKISLFCGSFNFFTFSEKKDKRTETRNERSIDAACRVVLSQNSNENKGQKDKLKEAAGAVLVWIFAGIFGFVFWGMLAACWWLGVNL